MSCPAFYWSQCPNTFYASMLHLLAWGNILILLCYWVPYGTRCHHMPNIESYFLKFSQPKGHWKICTLKALNFGPRSPISDLIYHPYNFWNFLSLYCFSWDDNLTTIDALRAAIWFCSGIKIVYCSALGYVLYFECLKNFNVHFKITF